MRCGRSFILLEKWCWGTHPLFQRRTEAFSLLEMSMVILIMGVMLSFSLPFLNASYDREKFLKTEHTFEQLSYNLAQHLLQTGRLPCPANPSASTDDFGEENMMNCAASGIIPYKTLGISPALGRDGHGHFISYTVDPTFTTHHSLTGEEKSSSSSDPFSSSKEGESVCTIVSDSPLKIQDEKGQSLVQDSLKKPIFVLISHGKMGGHFLEGGERAPLKNKNAIKQENANGDPIFIETILTKEQDDRIFWKNRFSLLSTYAHFHCPLSQQ